MIHSMKRWRGLKSIVQDVVHEGSAAIERVHLATANRSFFVVEHIEPVADAARGIHEIHDATVSGVYAMIRRVNRAVGTTLDMAMDVVEALPAKENEGD
jgi:hypothetical protein